MRALKVCSCVGNCSAHEGSCPDLTPAGRCEPCERAAERRRGTASSRGYGYRWAKTIRPAFLRRHPLCSMCGGPATDADHWPVDRRELVAQGVADPDADERLRALCSTHHKRATAAAQPGGWNARA